MNPVLQRDDQGNWAQSLWLFTHFLSPSSSIFNGRHWSNYWIYLMGGSRCPLFTSWPREPGAWPVYSRWYTRLNPTPRGKVQRSVQRRTTRAHATVDGTDDNGWTRCCSAIRTLAALSHFGIMRYLHEDRLSRSSTGNWFSTKLWNISGTEKVVIESDCSVAKRQHLSGPRGMSTGRNHNLFFHRFQFGPHPWVRVNVFKVEFFDVAAIIDWPSILPIPWYAIY